MREYSTERTEQVCDLLAELTELACELPDEQQRALGVALLAAAHWLTGPEEGVAYYVSEASCLGAFESYLQELRSNSFDSEEIERVIAEGRTDVFDEERFTVEAAHAQNVSWGPA